MFIAKLKPRKKELTYINSGHPDPVLVSDSFYKDCFKESRSVLGVIENYVFNKGKIRLDKENNVILFTDGAYESYLNSLSEFKHLVRKLSQYTKSSEEIAHLIYKNAVKHSGIWKGDDITIMSLGIKLN